MERHKRTIGLRHVNAHSSQKELRLKVSSTVIQCLRVHSLRIKHSSSLATNWLSYKGYDNSYRMRSRRKWERVLTLHEFLRTREGDRRIDVCSDQLQRNVCNRGRELLVVCILVQRHEAAIQEGVMKFHLCLVSFSNTPVPLFSCRHFVFVERRSRFLLRKHCRVGTFIRIDLLFLCFCAAHSLCPIQTRLVLTRPCIFVAWLKPLHPSHLEVWFFQPCHHTHVSSLPGH